ncbi:hypothetical protein Saso_16500 [Streptomyces asoensis]|uniref:Secreted protein n=1 Tax=Streptomyces asoensis TaxID=249586 RepID=A0ABQ3RW49_9ACTN|nr:hypothetical protein GCM10010496_36460 [Streptomyces asoensis]GHI60000.1 hypothetical protein Saso_16500 [Streptomyces asoensis]
MYLIILVILRLHEGTYPHEHRAAAYTGAKCGPAGAGATAGPGRGGGAHPAPVTARTGTAESAGALPPPHPPSPTWKKASGHDFTGKFGGTSTRPRTRTHRRPGRRRPHGWHDHD